MSVKTAFFALVGLVFLAVVLLCLRDKRMEVKYAIVWLFLGITVVLTPILYPLWRFFGSYLSLFDPNLLAIVFGLIIILLLCFQFTLSLSKAKRERKILAQKYSRVVLRLDHLEAKFMEEEKKKKKTQKPKKK